MELQLKGKRVIVTGASRGIGREIAERLADEGAALAICARDGDGLADAAEALEQRSPQVVASAVDIRDPDRLRGFIADAIDAIDAIDALVRNLSAYGGEEDDRRTCSLRRAGRLSAQCPSDEPQRRTRSSRRRSAAP
jgi:3-oxoacyl-[acyl-carrier protein] reductase